jgi:hypothetical protein
VIAGDECGGAQARVETCELGAYALAVEAMTASEQMFFMDAPLAHVVRYEHELRVERRRRTQHFRPTSVRRARLEALWAY